MDGNFLLFDLNSLSALDLNVIAIIYRYPTLQVQQEKLRFEGSICSSNEQEPSQ